MKSDEYVENGIKPLKKNKVAEAIDEFKAALEIDPAGQCGIRPLRQSSRKRRLYACDASKYRSARAGIRLIRRQPSNLRTIHAIIRACTK